MKVGGQNFLVLSITEEHGRLTGYLRRPQHLFEDTNGHFTHIASPIIKDVIQKAAVSEGHLAIHAYREGDPSDQTDYSMTLHAGDQADLRLLAFPASIKPWKLERNQTDICVDVATEWPQDHSLMQSEHFVSNQELKKMFEDDQKARLSPPGAKIDWAVISKQDEERRAKARKMIEAGQLHTAEDFTEAAFLFQHGATPDEYLLAHTLALIAISKGEAASTWIAAATLDRYLQSIKQPQIYGTQFSNKNGSSSTQEPYNTKAITDILRKELGVPEVTEQKKQLEGYNHQPPK